MGENSNPFILTENNLIGVFDMGNPPNPSNSALDLFKNIMSFTELSPEPDKKTISLNKFKRIQL